MKDTLLKDRYRLLELIASGGEAQVWRARDEVSNLEVAARMTKHESNLTTTPLPSPPHPGWVRLLDSGSGPGSGSWQIFELLPGSTLSASIKSSPLDFQSWHEFVTQSLDAVAALHNAGWVHGDLNAENFIRSGTQWKLLELPFFRAAHPAGRSALFGSIYTLSPEQLSGQPAKACSDVYALGCLYYVAASGEFPHNAETSVQIAIERARFDPAPLAEKAPHLPPAWSDWVMILLTRDSQNRPADAAAARHLLGVA